jgi:hypothetical protein
MNPYNWRADYGNSNWDIRHRVVASFVYDIPFFSGANSVLKTVLGNWQANGIVTIRGGLPFNVSTATDTANTASSGTYRPNLLKTPTANCGRGHLLGCIDASAFTIGDLYPANPNNYAYGNAGRNLLRGPAAQEVNFSVAKNFLLGERVRFQFRFETFNLFNHANFGNPSATLGTAAFGSITGLAAGTNNRQIQVGGKLAF